MVVKESWMKGRKKGEWNGCFKVKEEDKGIGPLTAGVIARVGRAIQSVTIKKAVGRGGESPYARKRAAQM